MVLAGIGFARGGVRVEPGVDLLAGKFADQDHGIGDGSVGSIGVGHAVHGDGDLVEIAFPVDAGGVNKCLVLGLVGGGLRSPWRKARKGVRLT